MCSFLPQSGCLDRSATAQFRGISNRDFHFGRAGLDPYTPKPFCCCGPLGMPRDRQRLRARLRRAGLSGSMKPYTAGRVRRATDARTTMNLGSVRSTDAVVKRSSHGNTSFTFAAIRRASGACPLQHRRRSEIPPPPPVSAAAPWEIARDAQKFASFSDAIARFPRATTIFRSF